jgi:[FeFe] hydrogenase H-cluster maturation GTPase HydF
VLDCDARAIVVKERELADTLDLLKNKPTLVITDSQAVLKVSADVPEDIPLTTFSILFARWKGDLETFLQGTKAIDSLKPGAKILVAESCTHHPIGEDIGRVKIPRWLRQYVGGELHFDHVAGLDFPDNLADYDLVVQCGSCMTNRREVLRRILQTKAVGVPITNYGLCISKSLGVLKRAISPFPALADIV